ncbi:helix-turn-helix domain-containing protein [Bradyrhizobium sp. JR3.5]
MHFVIRQPDATLTLLPAWMTAPAAASFRLTADPRLPVDRLLEARVLADAVLASSPRESSQSRGGGHGGRITAAVLNRAGKSTGRGNNWTRARVCHLRNQQAIAPYREGERKERGEITLDEAAAALQVSPSTVHRLIAEQSLPAHQLCKGRTLGDQSA